MKISELTESREIGEWVYHASHVPAKDSPGGLARWLKSILSRGLQPSSEGYMGPGTYFAYTPGEGYYHVDEGDSVVVRAKWSDLQRLYGVYPERKDGIQRDDDQIIVPGAVPGKMLEMEYFPDEWWTLEDAFGAETGH